MQMSNVLGVDVRGFGNKLFIQGFCACNGNLAPQYLTLGVQRVLSGRDILLGNGFKNTTPMNVSILSRNVIFIGENLSCFQRTIYVTFLTPGGYLMERWVRGCAAQIGCFFGLSGLPMAPFYLKIGLDIGCVFAKYIIFNEFSLSLPIGCQKVLMSANLHGYKVLIG